MDEKTVDAFVDAIETAVHPVVIDAEVGKLLVVHASHKTIDLEEIVEKHLYRPSRPKGRVTAHTIESLIEHAKRHATSETQAFCSLGEAPRIVVTYNDVPSAAERGDTDGAGGHRDHVAHYEFPLSDSWKRWTAAAGKPLSVIDFAQLLEDGIADVRDPVEGDPTLPGVTYARPHELLKLADGLQLRVEQRVSEVRRRDNGTADLYFAETHTNEKGEALRVPNGLLLNVPVFVDGVPYGVPARLRYRASAGSILWTVSLHNANECRREAAKVAAEQFRTETKVPLFYGEP